MQCSGSERVEIDSWHNDWRESSSQLSRRIQIEFFFVGEKGERRS